MALAGAILFSEGAPELDKDRAFCFKGKKKVYYVKKKNNNNMMNSLTYIDNNSLFVGFLYSFCSLALILELIKDIMRLDHFLRW